MRLLLFVTVILGGPSVHADDLVVVKLKERAFQMNLQDPTRLNAPQFAITLPPGWSYEWLPDLPSGPCKPLLPGENSPLGPEPGHEHLLRVTTIPHPGPGNATEFGIRVLKEGCARPITSERRKQAQTYMGSHVTLPPPISPFHDDDYWAWSDYFETGWGGRKWEVLSHNTTVTDAGLLPKGTVPANALVSILMGGGKPIDSWLARPARDQPRNWEITVSIPIGKKLLDRKVVMDALGTLEFRREGALSPSP